MHIEAWNALLIMARDHAPPTGSRGLELGALDLNGSLRTCFPTLKWTGVDLVAGRGVDTVADAADYRDEHRYDVILCTEVAEHTRRWREIIATARYHLTPDGVFLFSCAGEGRGPHSAVDGEAVRDGEFYANVDEDDLRYTLQRHFRRLEVRYEMASHGGDLYAWARP